MKQIVLAILLTVSTASLARDCYSTTEMIDGKTYYCFVCCYSGQCIKTCN